MGLAFKFYSVVHLYMRARLFEGVNAAISCKGSENSSDHYFWGGWKKRKYPKNIDGESMTEMRVCWLCGYAEYRP